MIAVAVNLATWIRTKYGYHHLYSSLEFVDCDKLNTSGASCQGQFSVKFYRNPEIDSIHASIRKSSHKLKCPHFLEHAHLSTMSVGSPSPNTTRSGGVFRKSSFLTSWLVALLLMAPFDSNLVSAQTNSACLEDFTTAYAACEIENYCTCGNCDDITVDLESVWLSNGGTMISCSEAHEHMCPWIRCCSACWESRQTLMQCTVADALAGSLIEASCTLDCSGYDAKDEPTLECIDGCGTEYGDFVSCVSANCQETCQDGDFFSLEELYSVNGDLECDVLNNLFCPAENDESVCCPECRQELGAFFVCSAATDGVEDAFDSCHLDCVAPVAPVTAAPVELTPPTPSPSTAVTTLAPALVVTSTPTAFAPIVTSLPTMAGTDGMTYECGNTLFDLTSCIAEHVCTCAECPEIEDIEVLLEANGGNALSCTQVHDAVCPAIRCCSDCWEAQQSWMQCGVLELYEIGSMIEPGCELDCSGFPVLDEVDEDCVDSCGREAGKYTSCIIQNCPTMDSVDCTNIGEELDLYTALAFSNDCGDLNEAICLDEDESCCPLCDGIFANLIQCAIDSEDNNVLKGCDIECADDSDNGSGNGGNGGGSENDDEGDGVEAVFTGKLSIVVLLCMAFALI